MRSTHTLPPLPLLLLDSPAAVRVGPDAADADPDAAALRAAAVAAEQQPLQRLKKGLLQVCAKRQNLVFLVVQRNMTDNNGGTTNNSNEESNAAAATGETFYCNTCEYASPRKSNVTQHMKTVST